MAFFITNCQHCRNLRNPTLSSSSVDFALHVWSWFVILINLQFLFLSKTSLFEFVQLRILVSVLLEVVIQMKVIQTKNNQCVLDWEHSGWFLSCNRLCPLFRSAAGSYYWCFWMWQRGLVKRKRFIPVQALQLFLPNEEQRLRLCSCYQASCTFALFILWSGASITDAAFCTWSCFVPNMLSQDS